LRYSSLQASLLCDACTRWSPRYAPGGKHLFRSASGEMAPCGRTAATAGNRTVGQFSAAPGPPGALRPIGRSRPAAGDRSGACRVTRAAEYLQQSGIGIAARRVAVPLQKLRVAGQRRNIVGFSCAARARRHASPRSRWGLRLGRTRAAGRRVRIPNTKPAAIYNIPPPLVNHCTTFWRGMAILEQTNSGVYLWGC